MAEQAKRKRLNLPKLYRSAPIELHKRDRADGSGDGGDGDTANLYDIAISSEYPVDRWFGTEILLHNKSAVDLSRLRGGAAVLVDHYGDQVGVVTDAHLDDDKVLRGTVQFSRNTRGQEIERDVVDGIRRHISVGYMAGRAKLVEAATDGTPDVWHVTRWTPLEVSVVSVPADPTVGVNRNMEGAGNDQFPVEIEQPDGGAVTEGQRNMEPKNVNDGSGTVPVVQATASGDGAAFAARAAEIARLANRYGMGDRAHDFITSGKTVDEVANIILADMETRGKATPARELALDLPKREARRYSYARAITLAAQRMQGQPVSGLEIEVHDAIAKQMPSGYSPRGGLFVPLSLNQNDIGTRAGLDSKTSGAGLELVFDEQGEFIELLRNNTAVIKLGARVLPGLTNPVTFPKQTAGGTFYWMAENSGADVTQADLALGTVLLSPKTVMGRTAYSRQLLQIGSLGVEQMVRDEMSIGHSLAIDFAAIHGLGSSNEPTGVYAAAGTNAKAMAGAATFAKLVDMTGLVAEDNAIAGSLGWLAHPLTASVMMQTLVASAAGSAMTWTGPYDNGQMAGYKAIASSQVSKIMTGSARTGGTDRGLIFANWSDMLIGMFGAMELVVDPYTLAGQGMVRVISFQMADIAIRHGESFCKATGMTS